MAPRSKPYIFKREGKWFVLHNGIENGPFLSRDTAFEFVKLLFEAPVTYRRECI